MDYKSIAKLFVKMGMYCFDVGSDVANGVHFLHGDDRSDGKRIYNPTSEHQFFQNETQFYNKSYTLTQDQNTTPDKDWGALTLTLVFVPEVVWGVANEIGTITKGCMSCRAWMNSLSEIAMGALLPVWFPFWFLCSIVRICLKKEEGDHNEQYMIALSGMEASLEALPQLVLQLHAILNGHSTSVVLKRGDTKSVESVEEEDTDYLD